MNYAFENKKGVVKAMKTITHTVKDPNGIHARPAGIIVNESKKYSSEIKIKFGENYADCKRIFSVMGLSIKSGDSFIIEISGSDEAEALVGLETAIKESGI